MLKFLALKFKNQSINEVRPYEPQVEEIRIFFPLACVSIKLHVYVQSINRVLAFNKISFAHTVPFFLIVGVFARREQPRRGY